MNMTQILRLSYYHSFYTPGRGEGGWQRFLKNQQKGGYKILILREGLAQSLLCCFFPQGWGHFSRIYKLEMLETSNLARKYIHRGSFRKYTFQYQGPINFDDVSIFLAKIVP